MTIKTKRIALAFSAALFILTGAIAMTGCAILGTSPAGDDLARMQDSPQYDKDNAKFDNRRPGLMAGTWKRLLSWDFISQQFFGDEIRKPENHLPEAAADLSVLNEPSAETRVVWFGHSSFLIHIAGTNVLVDPVFSGGASPLEFMVPRFQAPAATLDALPRVDVILITHDHYDHLDMKTIRHFSDTATLFITPLGVGSHLKGWGIDAARITELDWWQTADAHGVQFTATPAQHFSGRSGFRDNQSLWAGWAIKGGGRNLFYSGDSGYDTHFKEIGKRLGPFDIAFLENGQYNERWEEVHMLPEQTAQAFIDVRAKRLMPVHWGMFVLSLHDWFEPARAIAEQADMRGIDLVTPQLGELITLNDALRTARWWESFMPETMQADATSSGIQPPAAARAGN